MRSEFAAAKGVRVSIGKAGRPRVTLRSGRLSASMASPQTMLPSPRVTLRSGRFKSASAGSLLCSPRVAAANYTVSGDTKHPFEIGGEPVHDLKAPGPARTSGGLVFGLIRVVLAIALALVLCGIFLLGYSIFRGTSVF